MTRQSVYRVNLWITQNISRILWLILTGAVALQQFPVTEPLVLGFFWISIISFFAAVSITIGSNRISSFKCLLIAIGIQLLGIALQVYLVVFYWDLLCAIDHGLHQFRENLVSFIYPDHRLIGWIVWTFFTFLLVKSMRKYGGFFIHFR